MNLKRLHLNSLLAGASDYTLNKYNSLDSLCKIHYRNERDCFHNVYDWVPLAFMNLPNNGWYKYGHLCWFTLYGNNYVFGDRALDASDEKIVKAMKKMAEQFNHNLKVLNAEQYNSRQITAIRDCIREGVSSKEQRNIVYYYDCGLHLKDIGRSYDRYFLRRKK